MFGEFCYCSCLLLLPSFACSIHATWEPPFSRVLYCKEVGKEGAKAKGPFCHLPTSKRGILFLPLDFGGTCHAETKESFKSGSEGGGGQKSAAFANEQYCRHVDKRERCPKTWTYLMEASKFRENPFMTSVKWIPLSLSCW